MFCEKCGTENVANAKFCENCGIQLIFEKQKKKVNKKPIIILSLVIVVAIISVTILVFALGGNGLLGRYEATNGEYIEFFDKNNCIIGGLGGGLNCTYILNDNELTLYCEVTYLGITQTKTSKYTVSEDKKEIVYSELGIKYIKVEKKG